MRDEDKRQKRNVTLMLLLVYTGRLFDSIPKMDADDERLSPIPGLAPNSTALPSGCYFHPRCKYCQERCREQSPAMKGDTHQYKCWLDFE